MGKNPNQISSSIYIKEGKLITVLASQWQGQILIKYSEIKTVIECDKNI